MNKTLNTLLAHFTSEQNWWDQFHLAYLMNPTAFIEDCITLNTAPIQLLQHQRDLVEIYEYHDHVYVASARQVGLSTINNAFMLWQCVFQHDTSIQIFAQDDTGACDLRTIRQMYDSLPNQVRARVKIQLHKTTHGILSFDNGSSITVLSTSFNALHGIPPADVLHIVRPSMFSTKNLQEVEQALIHPTVHAGGSIQVTDCINANLELINTHAMFACKIPWNVVPGRDQQFKDDTIRRIGQQAWNDDYGD